MKKTIGQLEHPLKGRYPRNIVAKLNRGYHSDVLRSSLFLSYPRTTNPGGWWKVNNTVKRGGVDFTPKTGKQPGQPAKEGVMLL